MFGPDETAGKRARMEGWGGAEVSRDGRAAVELGGRYITVA